MNNRLLAEAIVVASWTDGWATLIGLARGVITEVNPIMAAVTHDPVQFTLAKVLLTVLGVILLVRLESVRGLRVCLALYLAVLALHAVALTGGL